MSKKVFFSIVLGFFTWCAIAQNDYYWVGGSGFYDDVAHWASTSGGTDYRSVEPGPTDNVYFDENSGFTYGDNVITIRATGFAKDIIFNGTTVPVTFEQEGQQKLHIYGSSEWQESMTVDIRTIYYENTNEPKTILSNGVIVGSEFANVFFKEMESISLLDDFKINSEKNKCHLSGTLNTNGHKMKMYDFLVTGNATLNLSSSDIYVENTFHSNSANVEINPETSHIHFNGVVGVFGPYAGQSFHKVSFEKIYSDYLMEGDYNQNSENPVTFHEVTFFGNGEIEGYNQFENLILNGPRIYQFQPGKTQTITNTFDVHNEDCSGWSVLRTTSENQSATISADSNVEIDVQGVVFRDIHAEGDAEFTAQNSVDDGNNAGWTFTSTAGQDLYWVGEGDDEYWNNVENWATTSGGAGGACVPGPNTNVFFDENSGFTSSDNIVRVAAVAFAKDITFNNTTVPVGFGTLGHQELHIYGSSVWQENMIIEIDEIFYENANEPKTILSNGVQTGAEDGVVYFKEEESISLLDDFKARKLSHQTGTWNTNGHAVTMMIYEASTENYLNESRELNLSSSDIFIHDDFYTNAGDVVINPGTSHIHFVEDTGLFVPLSDQSFYDVSFEEVNGSYQMRGGSNQYIDYPVTFHQVTFFGDGRIEGYNEFESLILNGPKTYEFQRDKIQTITGEFEMYNEECTGWSVLKSNIEGVPATISADSNVNIDVQGVIFQDIHTDGEADFIADNSIDHQNNSGWTFTAAPGLDLYWVGDAGDENWNNAENWSETSGGTGGTCVPGPRDNVFFDENSGFTEDDNLVKLPSAAFVKDITFNGTAVPVELMDEGEQELHVYGSSEWQENMNVNVKEVYYENTNEPKTILSNGVLTGSLISTVYFKEKESVSLLDDFRARMLIHQAGTWNTSGHTVDLSSFRAAENVVLNLSNSDIFVAGSFFSAFQNVVINPGTSHIHFEGPVGNLSPYSGQSFHDVSFENFDFSYNIAGYYNQNNDNPVTYNQVEFYGDGGIGGENEFQTLILHGAKSYQFEAGKTQTIDKLQIRGTPCDVVKLRSTQEGNQAKIEVIGEQLAFNFVNVRDIKVIGEELYFDEQSTDAGNNENMYFEPYFPGSYDTYLGNWECYVIDEDDPSSYTVSTHRFYGYENTDYEWYKMDEETGEYGEVISEEENISIHPNDFGPGTYKVVVTYHERPDNACLVFGEVTVPSEFDVALPNANPYVCEEEENTLEDVVMDEENVKWYATEDSEEELPLSTAIQDGETYWVTHQPENCESERLAVTITMVDCSLYGELTVTKTVTNGDNPDSFSDVGDVVEYEIIVTNIGQSPVFDIEITDENADETAVGTIDELAGGASETFTATHTITQDDIDAGFVSNLAIAQGLSEYDHAIEAESEDNDPLPDIPTDPDCEHCTIAPVRQGPTAVDDNRDTYPSVEITIAVLENDEEGNSVIIPEEVRLIDLDNGQEVETVTITGEGTFTTQEDGTVDFQSGNDFSGTVTPIDYIIYDENNLSDQATIYVEVNELTQPIVSFEYASETYCQLEENPTPILPDDFTEDGIFTATPNGLVIDSSSGNIDLAESDVGTYEVTYTIEEDLEEGIAGAEHTVEIEIIEAWFPAVEFDYGGSSFCALEEEIVPNLQDDFTAGGVFNVSPQGLVIAETTGVVDLATSDPGVYEVTYVIEEDMDECRAAQEFTVEIEVIEALSPEVEFDYGGTTFCVAEDELIPNLPSDFTEEGVFSASPQGLIIAENTGIIDLTTSDPGVYEITFIVEQDMDECRASGEFTVEIEIEEVTEPNLEFDYLKEFYCEGMENPIPQLGEDFTQGGVFNGSSDGLVIDPYSGKINLILSDPGVYEVTYSVEESMEECHSAGERTVTVEIEESTEPVVQFHYDFDAFCPGDENPTPIKSDNFTAGGEFVASPGGLSIDDFSGEIDLSSSMAGNYQVTYSVEEDTEICLQAGEYTVNVSIAENISFHLKSYCEENTLMIKPEFTNQPPVGVSYVWKDESGNVIGEEEVLDSSEALAQLPAQISLFIETEDCIWSESILVEQTYCEIPDGFSPNGDGINDSFDLSSMGVKEFKVYSRYGKEVYSKLNYLNEWEGQSDSGKDLPSATYYYVIKTKSGEVAKGWIYLNR